MTKYISILRGINVGGHRKILMADLKLLYQDLGFTNVVSYIQSGNVIFDSSSRASIQAHCKRIAQAIQDKYGYDVPVIIRTVAELEACFNNNPFAEEDINQLHLTFLSEVPDAEVIAQCDFSPYLPDKILIDKNNVYIHIQTPYHKSKFGISIFEKKFEVRATNRNWKTVKKLIELSK